MKKLTVSVLVLSLLFTFTAFASSSANRVYADAVTVESGEEITVPVKIENNEGFMGFAVLVTYDQDVFTPVSATKGSIVSGLFNDSIATSKTNTFKVVCSETGNITSDGVLFSLSFDVADGVSGKYEINLSYSQQDTFNENWDNVIFSCENIEVVVTENGTTAPTTVTTTEPSTKEETTTVPAVTEPAVQTTVATPETQVTVTEPATQPATTPSATVPDVEDSATQPVTEPLTEPSDTPSEKPLSVRMREWVKGLPFPFNILLGIIVIPVAFIISIFE